MSSEDDQSVDALKPHLSCGLCAGSSHVWREAVRVCRQPAIGFVVKEKQAIENPRGLKDRNRRHAIVKKGSSPRYLINMDKFLAFLRKCS